MTITEKVAHLKGFIEGIELDESTKEGKVIKAMVEILDDMALSISDIEDEIVDMSEQMEDMEQDLEMVIEDVYGDEEDEDEDGCCCGHCDEDDTDSDEDFDGDLYEVTCPGCGETICVGESILEQGEMTCPNCGENLEFELEEDDADLQEDDHSCCCGHCDDKSEQV